MVKLTTNGEVTATPDVSWITAPQTRAMAEKTFTFTVAKNVIAERVGHISFTLGNLTETVTVKQARKPFVIPDKLEDFNIRDYV